MQILTSLIKRYSSPYVTHTLYSEVFLPEVERTSVFVTYNSLLPAVLHLHLHLLRIVEFKSL